MLSLFQGVVRYWESESETESRVHGRREDGAALGQWEVSTVLVRGRVRMVQ